MRAFEYIHTVGFEETNIVGNVYYVNHVRWQGRCREMFLREHAPEILAQLSNGLVLSTMRCSCEYLTEVSAFDQIRIRMRLGELRQNRMTLLFDYVRGTTGREEVVAKGEQQIACMRRDGAKLAPIPVPEALRSALAAFTDPGIGPDR
jgi:enediyne biosynthesis thioesterase